MAKQKAKVVSILQELMAVKTSVLSQAQAMTDRGMGEAAQALWSSAASYEERLGPLLEVAGKELEAAVHRVSAASCYERAGDLSKAANLYRAALAGPLREQTRSEVEQMLADCLSRLATQAG